MIQKLMLILTVVSTASAFFPVPEPAKPKDCPETYTYSFGRYGICRTTDKYDANDLEAGNAYCKTIGMSLCSLNQMTNAWMKDYLDMRWGMYNVKGRDARVSTCGEMYTLANGECYTSRTVILFPVYLIPNTPRPAAQQAAYCCK